jgi:hypothetical protein
VRAYGAQISDCISAAFGDIPPQDDRIPSHEARSGATSWAPVVACTA